MDPGVDDLHGAGAPRTGASRSRAAHVFLFVAAVVVWIAASVGLEFAVVEALTEDVYLSEQARNQATFRAIGASLLAFVAFALVTMGPLASRVGYRFRDALFLLVPVYGYVFLVRIVWRWTGLPERYWEPSPPDGELDTAETAAVAPPRVVPSTLPVLGGVLGLVLVAVAVVAVVALRSTSPDDWRTTTVRGMSISLPKTYTVFTDAGEAAAGLTETGDPALDEFAAMIREFPDFFVFTAFEPLADAATTGPSEVLGTSVTILRFPSGGSLRETAQLYSEGMAESLEILAEETTTVGTAPYAAVRLEYQGSVAGLPAQRGVSYVIEGGTQVWILDYSTLQAEFERLSPTFDRSAASFSLP